MALITGHRLGPYEILAIIGEGGMGQVYRARDTKLQRHVAIKVLPDAVTGDAERIARFDREARTLATLNHPHIAQIYGTEQSGITHALVMELVEGEDLAQRIARGPLSWRETGPIARQIAEALEAAHEMGIVHRDLKPANIKVTPDGVVKVLDFGLAKAIDQGSGIGDQGSANLLANSPTITSPAGVTQAGMILGTAAYMSPEQSKGRPADKRSDVWAFGCVFYEMLTGRRAFPGDDVMETLSAVLRAEPDFAAIPRDVPANVRTLIEQCLIKDRRERISDVAVARYVLDSPNTISSTTSEREHAAGSRWMWALVAVLGIVAVAAVALQRYTAPATPPAVVVRSTIAAPTAITDGFVNVAISPQATYIAYAALGSNNLARLHLRRLSESVARALPGTEGGANPFFSPDGEWLGFFAAGKLKKVPVAGGAAQVLADAPSGRGASWATDGTIVFAPTPEGGLHRVSVDGGGAVTQLTTVKPTERSHRWPHVLPGARTVLFTIQGTGKLYDDALIAAVPIDGGEPQTIVEGGSSPQYLQSGHLVFGKAGTLLAIAFDPVAVRSSGAAITMIDNVRTNPLNGAVPFAVSSAGLLVYLPGESASPRMSLHRATRSGQTRMILENRLIDNTMNLSPDGHRLALAINDGQADIWTIDLTSNTASRFTFGPGSKTFPAWSRDGSRLYYGTTAGGSAHTVGMPVDRSGPEQTLMSLGSPTSVSPDGLTVLGRAIKTGFNFDVVGVDLSAQPPRDFSVVSTAANETQAMFSPDGHHVAYTSDENGRTEVFVQAYPSGTKSQITNGGGSDARWTRGGRELIYRNGQSLAAVPITLKPFSVGAPRTLFTLPNLFAFDVTADGTTFVVAQDAQNRENVEFVLVSGWFEELRAKVQPSR